MSVSYQCPLCRHYRKDLKCDAFPGGIPETILTGGHDHRKPYKGDRGIRWEPVPASGKNDHA